jgi:CO/xanthine dehydrogenase FAD-binding subunit
MNHVFLPDNLTELWSCLEQEPDACVYAGGTDLLVQLRIGNMTPRTLVCLERIGELQDIREHKTSLWIGACSTHNRMLTNPVIQKHMPVLVYALQTLGSPPIRNMGTIGGNVCTASPAGDCLPPLYVLQAEVELRMAETVRFLPIQDFITGPGITALRKGEILFGIRVKKPSAFNFHHFEKIGQRKALACSIANMACMLRLSRSGIVERARVAWGSVGPTIVTSAVVEHQLIGKRLTRRNLERVARTARKTVVPISDIRASADYRRMVTGNLLLRLQNTSRKGFPMI